MADLREQNAQGAAYTEALSRYLAAQEAEEARAQAAGEPKHSTRTNNQKGEEGRVRVSFAIAALLVTIALFFDGAQAVATMLSFFPFVGFVFFPITMLIGPVASVIFFFSFQALGVKYFSGKQAAKKIVGLFLMLVLGFIPIMNMVPEITAGVILLIIASRIEDTVGGEGQLKRIAGRRIKGRTAISRLNKRKLDRTKKRYDGKSGGEKKVAKEERQGQKRLNRFDRKTKQESLRMVGQVLRGAPKQRVDGISRKTGRYSEAERERQRGEPGYYDPNESSSPDEAVEEYENRELESARDDAQDIYDMYRS